MQHPTTGFTPTPSITDLQKVKNIIAAINGHWQDCLAAYEDGDPHAIERGDIFQDCQESKIQAIIDGSETPAPCTKHNVNGDIQNPDWQGYWDALASDLNTHAADYFAQNGYAATPPLWIACDCKGGAQ